MTAKQAAKLQQAGEDIARGATAGAAEAGRQAEDQVRKQAERLQQVQSRMLGIYSSFMTHWLQRRHSAAQATLEAAQRAMASNGQPASLPEIYSDWMNGSLERIAADIREYQACSSEMVAAMQDSLPLGGDFRAGAVSERIRD